MWGNAVWDGGWNEDIYTRSRTENGHQPDWKKEKGAGSRSPRFHLFVFDVNEGNERVVMGSRRVPWMKVWSVAAWVMLPLLNSWSHLYGCINVCLERKGMGGCGLKPLLGICLLAEVMRWKFGDSVNLQPIPFVPLINIRPPFFSLD